MYCSKCGKQIPDNSKFCKHCGTPNNYAVGAGTASGGSGNGTFSDKYVNFRDKLDWWSFAILVLFAIGTLAKAPLSSIIFLAGALIALPPIRKKINFNVVVASLLSSALFLIGIFAYSAETGLLSTLIEDSPRSEISQQEDGSQEVEIILEDETKDG